MAASLNASMPYTDIVQFYTALLDQFHSEAKNMQTRIDTQTRDYTSQVNSLRGMVMVLQNKIHHLQQRLHKSEMDMGEVVARSELEGRIIHAQGQLITSLEFDYMQATSANSTDRPTRQPSAAYQYPPGMDQQDLENFPGFGNSGSPADVDTHTPVCSADRDAGGFLRGSVEPLQAIPHRKDA